MAYSGDTAPTDAFVELARGCDLVIHEAAANPGDEAEAHSKGHSTIAEAVEAAERAGAKAVAPIHFYVYPPTPPPAKIRVIMPLECYEVEV